MSRARVPRRITGHFAAPAWLSGLALLVLAVGPAAAQPTASSSQGRDTVARTVIGAPQAEACGRFAAAGESSDQAIAACDRALRSERLGRANEIATHINRGALHLRRRAGEPALADFDAVIALDPQNAEAHLNRGAALIMVGRPGPAVAAITEALGLGVREPHKAYFNRGAAREALGDLHGALEDYTTALEIEPDWGPANAELNRFARTRQERLAGMLGDDGERSGTP